MDAVVSLVIGALATVVTVGSALWLADGVLSVIAGPCGAHNLLFSRASSSRRICPLRSAHGDSAG